MERAMTAGGRAARPGAAALLTLLLSLLVSLCLVRAAAPGVADSAPTGPGLAAAGLQPGPGQYFPAKARVMDGVTIAARTTVTVKIAGAPNVPTAGVASAAINFAVKGTDGAGGLVVFPSGASQPGVTGATYQANVYNHELMLVKVGADGQVKVANTGQVAAKVYADVHGYTLAAAGGSAGSTYVPLNTARVASKVSIPANGTATLSPLGLGGIPASGVSAVAFALVAKGTAAGKIRAYPSGSAAPVDTVLDYRANQFLSNMVFGTLGADGKIALTNVGTAAVDVYADVSGYFGKPASAAAGSAAVPVAPARIASAITIPANGTATLAPLGEGGVPDTGVTAVGINFTAKSTGSGSLRVHPSDQSSPPGGGSVDYLPTDPYAQYVPVKVGADGGITIRNAGSSAVTVWADVYGYFAAPQAPGAPLDVRATAGDGQVAVTWKAPADGGAAITAYRVTPEPSGDPVEVGGEATTATVTGLENGRTYRLFVVAVNAVGAGPDPGVSDEVAPQGPDSPVARFTVACDKPAKACTFDASTSTGGGGGNVTGYSWSFGDGASASGATASHTYGTSGRYIVGLVVTNEKNLSSSTQQEADFGVPPTASFSTACVNSTLTCTFDASFATDPDSAIATYEWDFGDGAAGAGVRVSHRFAAGTHPVTLKVVDDGGLSSTATKSLTVDTTDAAPTGRIVASCEDATRWCGLEAQSSDPDGEIVRYEWDLGDGTTITDTEARNAVHTYAGAGSYTVKVTLVDDQGAATTVTTQVDIRAAGDGAEYRAIISYTCVELQCEFDASDSIDSDGAVVAYSWDFGDGGTSTDRIAAHTYAAPGTYTVRLVITDDKNRTVGTTRQATA
ncbi:fibronectin type III domain-containing protein [Nonomuraea rhodomycinica]|uniref:PKD domain-containing protein n=1 Tax=Nonomuraea rhodomycinica TaxID=1712872 RepID=A0A7Y6MGZ6_9ACTN|nr:fibronectin type III domain-containing protein [Nonomuraea rhodomycinica]NUW46610.1 PKD domain-containing protein [Nonomuraea rhodomycinica]